MIGGATHVGRLQVLERLGAGGFATVWKAYDPELDAHVALKVLADNWQDNGAVRERFAEEARLLRRADSDRVVRVYDVGRLDDGRPYFVMTHADRGTLSDRLVPSRPAVADTLGWAAEAARGVAVLHDLDVLHRDVKPSNVLFVSAPGTPAGERLLVADLGLAKALARSSGFTVAAGTPGYMSPEQAELGAPLDRRADVYALGALTYRLLTGRVPAASGPVEPPSLLSAASYDEVPEGRSGALSAALPDALRAEVDAAVLRALDHDRDRRWPTARAYADALEDLRDRLPAAARAPGPAPAVITRPPGPGPADRPGPDGGPATEAYLPGPATPPARRGPRPGGRAHRVRRVAALVAGLAVLAGLLTAGGLTLRHRFGTTTVRSVDGTIALDVPYAWRAVPPTTTTLDLRDYGAPGDRGKALSTQPDPAADLTARDGFTVVAARGLKGFSSPPSARDFRTGEPRAWTAMGGSCSGRDEPAFDTADGGRGVAHVYAAAACSDGRARTVALVSYPGFGVEVFVVGKAGTDEPTIMAALASLRVDQDRLPRP